jgi:biopolymer transport protein ExbB
MITGRLAGIPYTALLMLASLAFAGPAMAQSGNAPSAEAPAATAPDAAGAPGAETVPGLPAEGAAPEIDPTTGLPVEQPAETVAPMQETEQAPAENPYGLAHMFSLENPDPVTFAVGIILAIMSGGSWLLFITKYMSSGALLGQAKSALRGAQPRGAFRALADDAETAAQQHAQIGSQVSLSDWLSNALNRSIDNIGSQLRGGNSFLATVASSAPFVGLFGTVYGILKALLAIGLSGQPSIDKVAGPVGEALIMTAIGLFAAVPAVIFYNVVIGRNRQVTDALRNYASDLQAQYLGATTDGGRRR